MSDQPRWPAGTPVAPSGKGPGGGRFRDRWIEQVVHALVGGQVPQFYSALQPTPEQLEAFRRALSGWRTGTPGGYEEYKAGERRFIDELGGGPDADMLAERIGVEHEIEAAFQRYARTHSRFVGDPEQFRQSLPEQMRQAWAGKPIKVRTYDRALKKLLQDGRFRTQHEENVIPTGHNDPDLRARVEAVVWGYDEDSDPEVRPVYGYVDIAPGYGAQHLEMYGDIDVVLRDSVRPRTTALFGDTLTHQWVGMPSPIDHPSWQSWSFDSMSDDENLHELDRFDLSQPHIYVEAQIHGGLTVRDIEKIILPYPPDSELLRLLQRRRIPWEVADV